MSKLSDWKTKPLQENAIQITPRIKRKKGVNPDLITNPFPEVIGWRMSGVFTGISVEISNKADMQALYENGFYGKGSKSRSAPMIVLNPGFDDDREDKINETLSLELEEAFVLAYILKIVRIVDFKNKELNWKDFFIAAESVNSNFLECLSAYIHLKSKNWVIKSGVKFGGQFLAYKKGPRFHHASFLVVVSSPEESDHFQSKDFKGLVRVNESSGKDVLLLEVTKPQDFKMMMITDLKAITISELMVNRFIPTKALKQSSKPRK